MTPRHLFALVAIAPLACVEATPAPVQPAAPPITTVSLDAPKPAPRPAEAKPAAPAPAAPAPAATAAADAPSDKDGDAQQYGMIGLLNSGAGGDPNAPTAPWGKDDSLGNDPLSAKGNMWGDAIGDSFGAGGLGLSGIGEGAGGHGEGIGLGNVGSIGHGAGTGTGQGFGSGHGRLGGSTRSKPPQIRMGATTVSGRLPPEVIQRIVRQNFGRFRLCYENGLKSNAKLEGKVSVKFVIDKKGKVSSVSDGGSAMPDKGVLGCILRAFHGLEFPEPEGGIVVVVYPILFKPGEDAPKPPAAPAPPAPPASAAPSAPPAPTAPPPPAAPPANP
jgi:hypothetical protein